MSQFKSLFEELKRRNIYKVAVAYGITGWVVIQIASIAANSFGAPAWVMKMVIILILLGFPVAIIFAWAFEITPGGIKRTKKVPKPESITKHTGKRLSYWIIGLLSAALIFFIVERFWFGGASSNSTFSENGKPSIAVLPFQDFSANGEQEWFSDGLTEELLNSLARLQGLRVAARTSSFHFKNKNIPIQQIADTLGVEHIVEGSVRRADSSMRITAQLIRADNGFHLWSQTYDRNVKDVFKVQEDISENIASAFNVYLDEEKRKKMFAFGTRNVEAYNAYMKGRNFYDKLHESRIDSGLFIKANPWFEKAIQLDPEFAAPYYYHHDAYMHYVLDYPRITFDSLSVEKAHNRMMTNLDQAIAHATDPGLKLMYRLEKTFLSKDWSRIPELVQQLKNSPEAKRAFVMLGGGWTRDFLNITGYARLQHQLTGKALKRDPLHTGLRKSQIDALMNFGSTGGILQAINNFSPGQKYPAQLINTQFLVYLAADQIQKADSVAQLANTSGRKIFNIMLQAIRGDKEGAGKNFRELPDEYDSFKNSYNSTIVHYVLGNIQKANDLALQMDTTALGSQKLMTAIGRLPLLGFDPSAMPSLGKRFEEASIEVEPVKIGKITLPRITQNLTEVK